MICPNCKSENTADTAYCGSCGQPMAFPTMRVAGQTALTKTERYAVARNPFIAALLSFVPPLGQLYNGDYKKAAVIVLAYLLLFIPIFGEIALTIVWFVNIFNSYQVAKQEKPLW